MDERIRQSGPLILLILGVLILTSLLGLSPQPHLATRSLQRAQHSMEAGMNLTASQHLSQAARYLPTRPELWEQAGNLALEGGDPQAAIEYFEQAAKYGLSGSGQFLLGEAYLEAGEVDSALRTWENLAQQDAAYPDVLERLADIYLEQENFSAAIHPLQALIAIKPSNAQVHYQLGLLMATQDPEAALVYLTRAAELDPEYTRRTRILQRGVTAARLEDDPAYRLMGAGRALANLEEWIYATEAFRQATILRPDYAEAWAYLGEALQHLPSKYPSQAVGLAELQKAVSLEPTSLSANTFLSLFWQRQGRYDLAQEAIQAAINLDPKNPVLQVELGNILALQGDLDAAYGAYLQAIAFAPNDPNSYNRLIEFCLTHDYHVNEIALPASRQALLLAPEDPASLDWMGQVLLNLGDLVSAERFFSRAIENDPQYAAAHLHLGMLYVLEDQTELAYQALTKTLTLAPETSAGKQAQRLLNSALP